MNAGEGKEKQKELKAERERNHTRLLIAGDKLRVPGGAGWGRGGWTLGIKEAAGWVRTGCGSHLMTRGVLLLTLGIP